MKKRLFSILAILGIGVSFCSADYTFNAFESRGIYDSNLQLLDSNFSFNINNADSYNLCSASKPWAGTDIGVNFSGFGGELYLKDLCIRDYSDSSFTINGVGCSVFTSGDYRCCDFSSNPIDLSSTKSFILNGTLWGNYISTICYYPFTYYSRDNSSLNDYFLSLDGSKYVNFTFSNSSRTFDNYIPVPVSFTIDYPSTPKFVVNYGNTSYEYELDSDLSIYLKSPVIHSGNTFSYVGSTGLNLFYNGLTQFYSKSNLYLDSNYRYNNNIFTPICN